MKRLPVTLLRFVAAAVVVVHHFGRTAPTLAWGRRLWEHGDVAVSFFFVLSGFVLAYAHQGGVPSARDFYVARVARILPACWLGLCGTMVYAARAGQLRASDVIVSMLFVQSWIPGWSQILNWPAWSLSVEIVFYLTFPMLLPLLIKSSSRSLVAVGAGAQLTCLAATAAALALGPARGSGLADFVTHGPLLHYGTFVLGVCGGLLFSRGIELGPWSAAAATALAGVGIVRGFGAHALMHNGLYAPLFVVIIWWAAGSRNRLLESSAANLLGEASYGLYILQAPVALLLGVWGEHAHPDAYFWGLFVLLVATSIASYQFVEVPARRAIRGLASRFSKRPEVAV